MKNKIILFSAVFFAAASIAFSQEAETNVSASTQKIKIRAKREIYDPLSTSLATTIITSDELKAKGADTLTDALSDSVGLQVQQQGASSTLNIRGSRTEQIQILINGVPLNNAQGLGVDLNSYGVQNVERIEIIRGSATARYGANASGGVINIITKDRVDSVDGIETRVRYGSFDNMGVSALASKSFGKENQGSIFVSGVLDSYKGNFFHKYTKTDGTTVEGRMGNNKSIKGSARAGISYKLNNKDIINFDVSAMIDDKQIPNSVGSTFNGSYGDSFQDVENYGANLSYENNSFDLFSFGVQANVLAKIKQYIGNSAFPPRVYDKYQNIDTGVSATLDRVDKFSDIFTFKNSFLLAYKNQFFNTHNPRPTEFKGDGHNVMRNNISVAYLPELGFMNFEGTSVSRLTLFPAIRFDAIIGSGAKKNKSYYEPSYSLGAMYTIDKERRYNIKANFNSGYRLPGFDDLYVVNSAWSKGNLDLKKETSYGGDLGFIITPHDIIRFEALYYVSEHNDLITWLVDDAGKSMPINVDKALLQGIEANLLLSVPIKPALSKVELNLNYLYQFGKIVDGSYPDYSTFPTGIVKVKNNQLARTPENSFNAMLSYIFEGNDTVAGRLNFLTQYIGKRYNAIDNKVEIPETLLFDITASLTLLDTITLEGGVKNIADVRYENVIGYPQPGREWYTAISAKF